MGHGWRQVPALLAGAGILAATLYIVSLPVAEGGRARTRHSPSMTTPVPALPATRPSDALARAVERAARGALPEPFFADRTEAARFLEHWQGRLIEGRALVARADDFDAGAENGHQVPVTLWLDSGSRVMGLTGEVAFEPTPGGPKLRSLRLGPVDLTAASWADAEGRLRKAQLARGRPQRGAAPFYGIFHFTMGGAHYGVDARTGEVTVQ